MLKSDFTFLVQKIYKNCDSLNSPSHCLSPTTWWDRITRRNPNPWSEFHLLQKSYVKINCFHTYYIQHHVCCPFGEQNVFYDISKTLQTFIALNFASHNLVMEIIWNLFFIALQVLHTNVMCLKHV
jgi:hypothetical protein